MTTTEPKDGGIISVEDKRSIVAFLKLIHARTKAGEDVCLSCYVKKTLDILDKYVK